MTAGVGCKVGYLALDAGASDPSFPWPAAMSADAVRPLEGEALRLTWDAVSRGLDRQSEILGDLRTRTGTIIAAAGVVAAAIGAVIAAAQHERSGEVAIAAAIVLAGMIPVLDGFGHCWKVLQSIPDDSEDDIDRYVEARQGGAARWHVGDADLGSEREWRVTVNPRLVRRLLDIQGVDNDSVVAEATAFVDLVRKRNWDIVHRRTDYFDAAIKRFAAGLGLWGIAAVVYVAT